MATTPDRPEKRDQLSQDLEEQRGDSALRARELRRTLALLLQHPGLLAFGLLLVLVATAAALFEPRLLGQAIDEAILPRDEPRLVRIALIFLVVEALRVGATIGQSYCFTLLGQRVMQKLRLDLLSRLQRLPVSLLDRTPAGRLVTRVTNDIASLAEMFSAGFVTILMNVLTVLGILAWLFVLDFRLALVALAVFPVLLAAAIFFSGRLRVAYREARSRLSSLNAFLAENLMGIRVMQLFGRESRQHARFSEVNESYTEAQVATVRTFALFQPSITWASGVAMTGVVAYGGVLAYEGRLAVGVLVSFFAYVLSVFQPIREIADKWNLFLSGMASAERIFSMLDWPVEDESGVGEIDRERLPKLGGEIVFEDVWFRYGSDEDTQAQGGGEGSTWVLRGLSFTIPGGTRLGVVGHTGAGKSTLISLLLRFYEPTRGRILLDGRELSSYDRRELRARIGMIQQDVFLFSGSIEDNIDLFRGDSGEQQSHGGRELSERGGNLSMGERQRIAFLRARAARPDLWILDEATSNVDSTTEAEISAMLRQEAEGCTQILVAHRLATIRDADLILVLHHGQLIESGTHVELLRQKGAYARMVALQRIESARSPVSAQASSQLV